MTSLFATDTLLAIRERLLRRQETIAVAESVTSGLVQAALSTTPDAIQFYQGGITTYNLRQKTRHLHVNTIHALSCNCVSTQVAEEMAVNVCKLFSSHWGLGITGYATPVPESNDSLFAHYCVARGGQIMKSGIIKPAKKAEPFNIQQWYANRLLELLQDTLT
jgi:nicotinamide-nucleotide amidase